MKYKSDLLTLQEQFDLGQKIANIGVWNLDYATDSLEWTEGVHHIYGTDPTTFKLTFDSFMSLVHPEDREKLAEAYFTSIEQKCDYAVEHRILLADGTIKYLKDRCQNFFDEQGNIIRSTGTTLDITKQKLLENEILAINKNLEKIVEQRTEEQNVLLSLFDKSDAVLFKWNNDEAWSVDHVSASVKDTLGYEKEDFLNHSITYSNCIHPDDLESVVEEVTIARQEALDFFKHKPYRIITKTGDIKWVSDSTVIVKDKEDNITHYLGYISDITEIQEKDKQLLNQSRMAQMGEMISMIAHQWRQPLSAISAASIDMNLKLHLNEFNLQKEDGLQNFQTYFHTNLERIDTYVQNLTTTIDDFRNFYKPNKDSVTKLIHAPVGKALRVIQAAFESNGIKIHTDYNCTNLILMHENELMQVVLNILKNSQDNFKEKGTQNPKILIKTFDTKEGSTLEISDNGGGITEDIMQKIFDPYFSTKDEKDGTGLGLYMSKTIVETHHRGKFLAKNNDEGVTFTVDLKSENSLE